MALLRFLMSVWVLLAHIRNFGQEMPVPSANALVAVYCFLAISGFSICHSITGQPNGYARRRFWRIAPTHFVSIAISLIAYAVYGPVLVDGFGSKWPFPDAEHWIGCLLLLQFLFPVAIAILTPAWSLSIEVVYYATAPILRYLGDWMVTAILVASSVFFLFRPFFSQMYIAADTHGLSTAMIFWSWLSGWLAFRSATVHRYFILCVIAGFAAIFADSGLTGWFNYSAWLAVITVVFYCRSITIPTFLLRALVYSGEISFPLYMVHYALLFIIFNSGIKSPHGIFQIVAALSTAAAVHHLIEKPLRSRSKPKTLNGEAPKATVLHNA